MRKIFLISIISFSILISVNCKASDLDSGFIYRNEIKKNSINTVQMFPIGWELAEPVIQLKGDNQLLFSFDEIKENIQDYSYRILHCDKNWYNSGLSEFDFLEGFSENQITEYEHSFNTNVNYIHYSVKIPNDDISLKLSGNYVIEVYEDFDPEKVVIRQRFMILDSKLIFKEL
ncbi:type IX secretion system plug protein domain-containing protein [Marinifilum sp.]|uniref:type IX secretion system plug protein n=1 Tax=Marinifilum sp. TaxID=2033137 RepID=UPI003BAC08C9